ncbi:MAG: DUF1351 domain-containing protein [Roseburia sp.]|nr:DUF1351 domain-containing protein [Roseburia sp.]
MSEDIKKEAQSVQTGSLEFRLINPTEDGFLQRINWNKEELEEAVREKISAYENVVYSEENLKQAKADRAELNNLLKAIEERRKKVKEIVNAPYAVFEKEIKEVLQLIREPAGMIDEQIKGFENQQREEKKKKIREAYDENIGDLLSVLPFEKLFDPRYLNKTYKINTAIAEVREKIEGVKRDLETIDSLDSKYKLNAKDYYLRTLDLSKAMAENKRLLELEEKLEAEKRRKAEEERKRKEEEERKKEDTEQSRPVEPSYSGTVDPESADTQNQGDVLKSTENVPYPAENVPETTENVPVGAGADPFEDKPIAGEKKYQTRFYAVGTRQQLSRLKEYMEEHGIQYGKVE